MKKSRGANNVEIAELIPTGSVYMDDKGGVSIDDDWQNCRKVKLIFKKKDFSIADIEIVDFFDIRIEFGMWLTNLEKWLCKHTFCRFGKHEYILIDYTWGGCPKFCKNCMEWE